MSFLCKNCIIFYKLYKTFSVGDVYVLFSVMAIANFYRKGNVYQDVKFNNSIIK